ncbi:MAG: VOC family protein [Pseudomonadota bacterium]|uniref:VOC family protein n=1 Tax=Silanimonas sp. TaxID=1929290 RepID=UPI00217A703F|nr:VOC family protein [Silanimonas sp.]MCA3242610.1 VOC family protein [Rubrivivax sp.]MCA3251980.1 VOC family protein [Rubrivivax sp.]MCZ8031751.1 VOC family protein [Rubrivivax sp.]MCZ8167065.1 VOC family protein [Silanimonas sp.]
MSPKTLDHFVILVEPLEPAVADYQRLGFHVRPIARHLSIGSSNAVIHLHHTYLELFTLGDAPALFQDAYRPRLQAGPGLCHVSLDSQSLEADQARLQAAGLQPGAIASARRRMVHPDGREDETASSFMYCWREQHRYLSLFVSHHAKPETIFIDGHVNHANSAQEVTRCVFQSEEPALDLPYFRSLYGRAATDRTVDGFRFLGPRGEVSEVITPAAAAARYGAATPAAGLAGLGALPLALHYRVGSMAQCEQHLRGAGLDSAAVGGRLVVPAALACGVVTVFEAA